MTRSEAPLRSSTTTPLHPSSPSQLDVTGEPSLFRAKLRVVVHLRSNFHVTALRHGLSGIRRQTQVFHRGSHTFMSLNRFVPSVTHSIY